jgi:hypothetical protein
MGGCHDLISSIWMAFQAGASHFLGGFKWTFKDIDVAGMGFVDGDIGPWIVHCGHGRRPKE